MRPTKGTDGIPLPTRPGRSEFIGIGGELGLGVLVHVLELGLGNDRVAFELEELLALGQPLQLVQQAPDQPLRVPVRKPSAPRRRRGPPRRSRTGRGDGDFSGRVSRGSTRPFACPTSDSASGNLGRGQFAADHIEAVSEARPGECQEVERSLAAAVEARIAADSGREVSGENCIAFDSIPQMIVPECAASRTCGICASIGLVRSWTVSVIPCAFAQSRLSSAPVCVLHVLSATPDQPNDRPLLIGASHGRSHP